MGYWVYRYDKSDDPTKFYGKKQMWEYIRDNEYYADDLDFERWLDNEYSASQIVWRLRDNSHADEVLLDLYDEFEEKVWWDDVGELEYGKDFDYNGFEFLFIPIEDDDEDDDDEDD